MERKQTIKILKDQFDKLKFLSNNYPTELNCDEKRVYDIMVNYFENPIKPKTVFELREQSENNKLDDLVDRIESLNDEFEYAGSFVVDVEREYIRRGLRLVPENVIVLKNKYTGSIYREILKSDGVEIELDTDTYMVGKDFIFVTCNSSDKAVLITDNDYETESTVFIKDDDLAILSNEERFYILNKNKDCIIIEDYIFEELIYINSLPYLKVKDKYGSEGILDVNGKEIIPVYFESVKVEDDKFLVTTDLELTYTVTVDGEIVQ